MPIYTPAIKAYRSCGFHNHTIEELRRDPSLRRRAILNDEDHIAHVPNVFGSYQHKGITYHTVLTLVGLDDPVHEVRNSSRGVSSMQLVEESPTAKLWQFKILIPKTFCFEKNWVTAEADPGAHIEFCKVLCDRTEIFAMEFLCCYRFFIEQVLETYEAGNSEVREPVREKDEQEHPKIEEVEALICTYERVACKLKDFEEQYDLMELDFSSIQQFLGLHEGRTRTSMWPYYKDWLLNHRVHLELVERKTMEYISMAFLEEEYPS